MLYLIPGLRCHKHPIAELIRIRNQPWLQPIRDGQPRHDLEILSKIRTFEADSGTGLPPDTDTSSESELWTKEYSKIRSGYKGPGLRYGYTSDNLHQMTQIVGLVNSLFRKDLFGIGLLNTYSGIVYTVQTSQDQTYSDQTCSDQAYSEQTYSEQTLFRIAYMEQVKKTDLAATFR